MFPSIANQNVESSVLRRLIGSTGHPRKSMTPEKEKAQKAVLDSMLDPCSVEGTVAMEIQEPHRLSCVANLQKIRAELNNKPVLPASTDSFPNTKVIAVKEMKPMEPQQKDKISSAKEDDDRPLKSLHWKALGTPVQGYVKRHQCEGIPGKCEKCRRMIEIRKATERLIAKRAAKQILQESKPSEKALEEVEPDLENSEQKIKREERFCKIAPPIARTSVQKSKRGPLDDINFLPIGGKCKWAQPVLSEMPAGVYMGHPIDPIDLEDMSLGRDIPSLVSELKFEREYMDDEPDFESEKIQSWELAPRSKTNIVFIPPNWCEPKYTATEFLEPKIRIIDTTSIENDSLAHIESRGLVPSLRNLLPGKSQISTEVIDIRSTGNTESWADNVTTSQQLEERGRIR